jgi:MFS family permease
MANASSDLASEAPGKALPRSWFGPWPMLVLLVLIGTLNYVDRVLPAVLAQPIKRDIALSDTTLGLISGAGFLVIYGAATIPLARISDRGRYGPVIVWSVTLWSAMTMIGGWTANAWQLAASRMGVALGEAGGVPAAHAYINRHFPANARTLALSIFTLCMPMGSMAGFAVGGVLGQHLGWRMTFVLMGAAGLALALVTYLAMPAEAGAGHALPQRSDRPQASLAGLFRKRSLVLTLVGAAFIAMGGYAELTFTPAFLMRSHDLSLSEAGLGFGISGGIAAVTLLLLLGWTSDRLSIRDARWLLGTVIVMIVICLPLCVAGYLASDVRWAFAGTAVTHGIVVAQNAPVFAALHRLAPLELRAQASALLLLAGAVLGGAGPLVTGAWSDALTPALGPEALSRALLVVPCAYALGTACFCLALISFRRDLAD